MHVIHKTNTIFFFKNRNGMAVRRVICMQQSQKHTERNQDKKIMAKLLDTDV